MAPIEAPYTLELHDGDDANGVANILASVLTQGIHAHPDRVHVARRIQRPVAVVNTDTDSAATVTFGISGARIYNDVVRKPAVIVYGRSSIRSWMDLSQLRMTTGGLLPVGLVTTRGLSVLGDILSRRLIVEGLLTYPLTSLRLIALLSVAD